MSKAYIYSSTFDGAMSFATCSNYDVYYPDTKERFILSYNDFINSFPCPTTVKMHCCPLGHLSMLPVTTFEKISEWNNFLLINNVGQPITNVNYTIRSLQPVHNVTHTLEINSGSIAIVDNLCNAEFIFKSRPSAEYARMVTKSMPKSMENYSSAPIMYYPTRSNISYEKNILNVTKKIDEPDYITTNKADINDNAKVSNNIFSTIAKYSHEEYQYINLLENILTNGTWEEGRNGRTQSIFGASMRFSLKNGNIPILTTKQTSWRTCLKELLWFIHGDTDNAKLTDIGVHIWDGNSSKEFLDSRSLPYAEGILGPIYGYQWRNFNAPYDHNAVFFERHNWEDHCGKQESTQIKERHDQLQQIIDALKDPNQRKSRRLIMTAWNPCQLDEMALPPCHVLCQFNVHDGNKLSCAMYQRSCDFFLGVPFNIASYSILTHLIAKHCGLEAYEFVHFMGNCHLYENAIDAAKLQITREPYEFPTISIKGVKDNINDYNITDFELNNYQCHQTIKVDMVA